MASFGRTRIFLGLIGILAVGAGSRGAAGETIEVKCPEEAPKAPDIGFREVYKGTPYRPGEKAKYEVEYEEDFTGGRLLAGYATLEVRSPLRHDGSWHRVFHLEAKTGDWFKAIFVAEEGATAYSRPWDYGVSKFYMSQNEGKLFSDPFVQKKWLNFDHKDCQVKERIVRPGEKEKNKTVDLARGAMDALSVIYHLREQEYEIGKEVRAPVYTSQKNWWLEATPIKKEKIKVHAGKFKAVKLKLQTYLGKELQQKGDVYAWIATEHKHRPLVQLKGKIRIGNVWVSLHSYKSGK